MTILYLVVTIGKTAIDPAGGMPAHKWRDQAMRESTYRRLAIVAAMAVFFGMAACSGEPRASAEGAGESGAAREGAGEHARSEGAGEHGEGGEGGEHGSGGEGEEESGEQIGPEDTWDATRNGARLVLSFDPASNAFVGTVENTTRKTLCAVRVEVHLSTGTELGPTERTDLLSGEKTVVELPTAGEVFDTWTAHPEVSPCNGV
jgi:hypothetical protein